MSKSLCSHIDVRSQMTGSAAWYLEEYKLEFHCFPSCFMCFLIHKKSMFLVALERLLSQGFIALLLVEGRSQGLYSTCSQFPSQTETSIFNFKDLKILKIQKFRMESSHSLIALLHQGTLWCQSARRPTYMSQFSSFTNNFFSLWWKIQFVALPFRLSTAPRVFIVSGLVWDTWMTYSAVALKADMLQVLEKFGWVPNFQKSALLQPNDVSIWV